MDTANQWGVSAVGVVRATERAPGVGGPVALLRPPAARAPLSREEAVVLAAWLVALADPSRELFDRAWREVTS